VASTGYVYHLATLPPRELIRLFREHRFGMLHASNLVARRKVTADGGHPSPRTDVNLMFPARGRTARAQYLNAALETFKSVTGQIWRSKKLCNLGQI